MNGRLGRWRERFLGNRNINLIVANGIRPLQSIGKDLMIRFVDGADGGGDRDGEGDFSRSEVAF